MSSSAPFDAEKPDRSLLVYQTDRTKTFQGSSYHNLVDAALTLLSSLQVTVDNGKVFVTAKKKVLTLPAVTKHKHQLGLGKISTFLIFF